MRCFFVSLMLIALALALGSCATMPPPTSEQIASADYGSEPENYQQIVKDFLGEILVDPSSAEYTNWKGPSKGWSGDLLTGYGYGWRVCVEVNAKNRMGGYNGRRLWYFLINNGRIVQNLGGWELGTVGAEKAATMCSSF